VTIERATALPLPRGLQSRLAALLANVSEAIADYLKSTPAAL
jgi:predicted DNA-binding protein